MLVQLVPECALTENYRQFPCGCDFVDVMQLVQNIMTNMIYLGTLVLVLLLVYVGFLYVTNPTNPANRTKARSVAISAVIGFVVMLGGFLIVSTVMSTFARQDPYGNWQSFFGIPRSVCEVSDEDLTPDIIPNIVRGDDSALATKLNIMCAAAASAGLEAKYEVRGAGERRALQEEGVRCQILVVPQITANHFSVYNQAGCQLDVTEVSCLDCITVPGIDFKDGDQVAQSYATQLLQFKNAIESQQREYGISFNWRVTEAFPPTANHACGCHRNGTCTDINLR